MLYAYNSARIHFEFALQQNQDKYGWAGEYEYAYFAPRSSMNRQHLAEWVQQMFMMRGPLFGQHATYSLADPTSISSEIVVDICRSNYSLDHYIRDYFHCGRTAMTLLSDEVADASIEVTDRIRIKMRNERIRANFQLYGEQMEQVRSALYQLVASSFERNKSFIEKSEHFWVS